MANISTWSTTAANNNSAAPDGWPEGMAPSGVNDTGREVMAAIRTWYESAAWRNLGDTPTYVSASSFTVSGDLTATYTENTPIRATDASTLYGYISSSSYSAPNTTVNVTLKTGSLSASLSAVAIADPPEQWPTPAFQDDHPVVVGATDGTKRVKFEVDGLTTATTRTITVPDADITLIDPASNVSFSANFTVDTDTFYVDATKNAVGVGNTSLSSWASGFSALQVGGLASVFATKSVAAAGAVHFLNNVYYDGSYRYITTAEASRYFQQSGTHTWYVASSGTAAATITWTTALSIANNGGVYTGSATGGSQGADTINASAVYDDGILIKGTYKDHGTKTGAYTLQLDEAEFHVITIGASLTLTIASALTSDRATVAIKNSGSYTTTLAGIDNNSPTLTVGTTIQDIIGLTKSHGKITCVATVLNQSAV